MPATVGSSVVMGQDQQQEHQQESITNSTVMRVVTMEGSPQREVFLLIYIVFISLLIRNVSVPWIFLGKRFNASATNYWIKFAIDFVFIVMPGLLCLTLCSSSFSLVAVVLTACLATLLFFVTCEHLISIDKVAVRHVLNRIIDEQNAPTTFVTYYRAILLSVVAVAILAVDFQVFPRHFAKTTLYGHSIMDIGVSSFVASAAIGSRLKTTSRKEGTMVEQGSSRWWWLRSSYVILPLIGLSRTLILSAIDYPQPINEYGVHWNFFYSMTFVKLAWRLLPQRYPLLSAVVVAAIHLSILMNGLEEFVMYGSNPRDNLLLANIEGIASLLGYLTIHYACTAVAGYVVATGIRVKSKLECCVRLFLLSAFFFLLQMASEYLIGPPSRRVANLSYILSQMSLLVFGLGCTLSIQMFNMIAWAANSPNFRSESNPFRGVQPCLAESINDNSLVFFLLANLFTGMVNLSFDTSTIDDVTAVFILIGYMLLLCIFVHYRGYLKLTNKRK